MGERRRSTGSFDVQRTTGSNEVLDRLFVYATLREGQTARSLIANQITRSVNASTTGAIYAFPIGYAGFVEVDEASNEASARGGGPPTASRAEPGPAPVGSMRVIGELVWLAELPATLGLLDAYEGEDFARVIKQVQLETGDTVWSWIYVLADPDTIKHGTLIDHGDWVRYRAESGT
jgi:gamma-glutamylcyclotransferase (GGCT)/AIG2-like uncharacterized protein YtfP